jgi:hypothetical protein
MQSGRMSALAPPGYIPEDILAQKAGLWEGGKPSSEFGRIMRMLSDGGWADSINVRVPGKDHVKTWTPTLHAIGEQRRMVAERNKSNFQRLTGWVGKNLKIGLEQSIQKSVYLALSAVFGVAGGILGAWILRSC